MSETTAAKKTAAKKTAAKKAAPAKAVADAVEETQTAQPVEEQQVTPDEVIRQSYQHANRVVRDENLARFNELRVAYCAERGITWAPRPTADEKAREALIQLVRDNPALGEQFGINLAEIDGADAEPEADAG